MTIAVGDLNVKHEWKGIATLARMNRERIVGNKVTHETTYYIVSTGMSTCCFSFSFIKVLQVGHAILLEIQILFLISSALPVTLIYILKSIAITFKMISLEKDKIFSKARESPC